MKRTKTNRALHALTLILLSALLYCCTDEHDGFNGPGNGKEKTVTFSVRVPGTSTPPTRALEEGDENEVKQIAVLLFTGGEYIYQPIYNNTITSSADGKTKTFTIKVPEGIYDMVILANANASLNSIINDIKPGNAKSDVLKKLVLTNEGKWNAKPGSDNYKPIPMWSEKQNITVATGMAQVEATLLRMVAKIDVGLATEQAQKALNLTSVRLYNYNNEGQIVPNANAWDSNKKAVTAPSVAGTLIQGPIVYENEEISKDSKDTSRGLSCTKEIYAFETVAGTANDLSKNTCLVIGGHYANETKETYYRIDLAATNSDGTIDYLPLLRNYQYKINVQSVSGSGLSTPEEAFNSRPVNIKASIIQWSESQFTDFAINDQYMVGVSQGAFSFSKESATENSSDNILSIITDYPKGWTISLSGEEGSPSDTLWLDCKPRFGKNPQGDKVRLLLAENKTGIERVAYINVKAERLNYKIKVTQSNTFTVGVHITDSEHKEISLMEFVSTQAEADGEIPPPAQKFNLNWSPKERELFYVSSQIGPGFEFNTGSGLNQLDGQGSIKGGSAQYTIQPKAISKEILDANPFYQRTSVYLYTISDGITTVNKSLTLRQYAYNMKANADAVYLMDGGKDKSFSIRANSRFTATIVDNPDNVVSHLRTSGAPNVSDAGTPVFFDVINDLTHPEIYQSKVKVKIESPDKLFNDTTLVLNCGSGTKRPSANSYILQPNSIGAMIPVGRFNLATYTANKLAEGEQFTAELIWTDNAKGMGPNSTIRSVSAIGTGPEGYLFVMAGSAPGNAVVAIKNMSGIILWSWHIWVSPDFPKNYNNTGFMDRNLGATSITPGDPNTLGLQYEWGRKDPFTSATTLDGIDEVKIYNAKGTEISFTYSSAANVSNNYANSVANPSTYYYSSGERPDWLGYTRNDDLWGKTGKKTVNDPCPYGWRVNTSNDAATKGTWKSAKGGQANDNCGGYYPIGNTRNGTTGKLYNGIMATYWTSIIYKKQTGEQIEPNVLYVTKGGGIGPNGTNLRSATSFVRCIRYTTEPLD